MKTKQWYKSKTIWIQIAGVVIAVAGQVQGVLPTHVAVLVGVGVNIATIFLRMATDTALTK